MAGKLKVAAVGCGGIGHLHQLGYLQHPGAELVAVCDIDTAKAKTRAEELGVANWYPSIKEMLAHEECDLVDVVTADYLHFEPVMECLEAGKHVISEKPLSLYINEAEQMVAKAEEKGVYLAIDYNRRFAPGYVQARKWFDAGEIGQTYYLDMKLSQGGPASTWKGEYYLLYELQTHAIDLLRWFGGEIVAVCAQMAKPREHEAREGEEACYTSMAISFRYETKVVATLMASWDSDFIHPIEHLEICGSDGEIVVDNVLTRATLMKRNSQVVEEYRPSIFRDEQLAFNGTFALRMAALVDDLLADQPPAPTGRDGLQALRITEAIVESWKEKREVTVKID
ncbi:Gfo/Idh/MocA family oxidoreductase [Candidatus Poribacteria bacterium]|nr:Gfo/Idh/MocA family oxidoreductase [Candidatus Poribacteria bacterium]MXY29506.1 Gfo/Idh/MocA family oxidoreductase [Candidatus Poribacteria bacterium]MYK17385.1 Gfo/Idh/MocA family oxidoreductase [Candidatus Poribacteria bacterium]